MIRASSYYNYYCRPASGRLNGRRAGRYGGAWCAKRSDRRQWLQVDFGAIAKVSRVATQGRQNSAQWVKSYYLSYSRNGYRFITYKENGRAKVSKEQLLIVLSDEKSSFPNSVVQPRNSTLQGNVLLILLCLDKPLTCPYQDRVYKRDLHGDKKNQNINENEKRKEIEIRSVEIPFPPPNVKLLIVSRFYFK